MTFLTSCVTYKLRPNMVDCCPLRRVHIKERQDGEYGALNGGINYCLSS